MMLKVSILLLSIYGCYSAPLSSEDRKYAQSFLQKYGYLSKNYASIAGSDKKEMMHSAIIEFQNMAGMSMTGELDKESMEMMHKPRCGMPDMAVDPKSDRQKRYGVWGTRWTSRELTYHIKTYTDKLKKDDISKVIHDAFTIWTKYVDIKFIKASNPDNANLNIGFYKRSHGDGNAFDGQGNVLAHAFFPQVGAIHFDDDENWSKIFLYQVAVHEIGHALGLDHSNIRSSVMFAYHNDADFTNNLHKDDVAGIQEIYNHYSSLPRKNDLCPIKRVQSVITRNNSFIVLGDEKLYLFKGELYYSSSIESYWNNCPKGATGLVFHDRLYFFKGGQYWAYKGRAMLPGYPKAISEGFAGIPDNVDAAMQWQNNAYFFKGDSYWVYDHESSPHVMPTYPKKISSRFPSIPSGLDAIFALFIGNTEFVVAIKGNNVYRFDTNYGFITKTETIKDLFGC